MSLDLIPQPHSLKMREGFFALPDDGRVGVSSKSLLPIAKESAILFNSCTQPSPRCLVACHGDEWRNKQVLLLLPVRRASATAGFAIRQADAPRLAAGSCTFGVSVAGANCALVISIRKGLKPGGYRLSVGANGIAIEAESVSAARSGLQTLRQIVAQCPDRRLPALRIDDWPDFPVRGIYYDVSRGRAPTIESLTRQIDLLSRFKINHYQLYIERAFAFRGHPDISRGVSPLTGENILKLDRYCRERGIEMVPSLASFGHMAGILKRPRYRELAEDWGIGKYVSPEAANLKPWQRRAGWSLSPANPKTYEFLDSLFADFLPFYSSSSFNVCCDETWDLGLGQSFDLCKQKGIGQVYLDHILKLRKLAAKHGKRIMFWGDMIRRYPKLISRIPKDVTVLDWGYGFNHKFDAIRDFKKAGLEFYACPGSSSWVSLFPRLAEAAANIHGFAEAGHEHGARGLLTTDWGDGGHCNFMEYSWHGYLFAAEQAWNVRADRKTFSRRFCKLFLNIDDQAFARAMDELGEVAHLQFGGYYQSVWHHVFFAAPGEAIFDPKANAAFVCRNGKISRVSGLRLDSKLGLESNLRLVTVRKTIAAKSRERGTDPHGILPYWLFAIDTLLHATKKLSVLGKGGKSSPRIRRELKAEMNGLMKRFATLWRKRNRESEIEITLNRYRATMRSLR